MCDQIKSFKIVLIIVALSASASAAVIIDDPTTYTFDGTSGGDVDLPTITMPTDNGGYTVSLEFSMDSEVGTANHLIHLENRRPVTRSTGQAEESNLVLEF